MDLAQQAPLPMDFCWQEYWSGLPFPAPGDLSDPGIKSWSLASPTLVGRFFTTVLSLCNMCSHLLLYTILTTTVYGGYTYPHFTEGETEAQRGLEPCSRSHRSTRSLDFLPYHSHLLTGITCGFLPRQIPMPDFSQLLFLNQDMEGSFFEQF